MTSVRLLLALALLPAGVGILGAQTSLTNGNVTGTVTDPTGAAVPGATVTLTDESTHSVLTTTTNTSGLYLFQNVNIGTYTLSVEKAGFRKEVVPHQLVSTGTNLTLNLTLQIGATSETVEVREVAGAELQTESATMGTSLGGSAVLQLPSINRDVSSLVFYQPTAAPTFNGAEGNITSGQVAGAMADQNTFMLDGGNNTSDLDGDNATYIGHNGSGVMPTPAESVEEFRVNTNNMTADFSMSAGGQVMVSTKRGTEQFHGSAYDWFQGDWLNSNDWNNNFNGIARPKGHFNRFGGALGGPLTPSMLGGKTYFYVNYEGQRFPRSGPYTAVVPSNTLRQGIIEERNATGSVVQYNVANYDPLGLGFNPVIKSIWNTYMPQCNTLNAGDHGLNTCGFIGQLNYPLTNDFGVVRIDHDFGSKWRFFGSYRYYRQPNPTTNQVDIGGLLPGDKLGVPAVASTTIDQPRYIVAGITGTISPTLTNDFHFSYTRNQWQWLRAGAGIAQYPGLGAPLAINGDNSHTSGTPGLVPLNINTQDARPRLWDGHDYDFRDNVSKIAGTHLIQFGGEFFPERWKFDRYDNVVGGLTQLIYQVSSSGINIPSSLLPAGLPTNEASSFKQYYSDLLGLVSSTNVVVTRQGAQLSANPIGTPVHSNVRDNLWNLYFNDTWKVRPNFTVSYGLNYQVQYPPTEAHGVQDIMVYASTNQPVLLTDYYNNILQAASQGLVYNPAIGFSPIGAVKGLKYPYQLDYGEFAPRASIAWTPDVKGGWLGALLGDKATVIRAGYARIYGRNLGIDLVSTPVLGDGFLQPVSCTDPTSTGACTKSQGATPSTAFRIGTNGLVAPVGAIASTLPTPVVPGVNAPTATLLETLDGNFRPSNSDQIDISIQRQFKGNTLLEVGYVGVYSRNLYAGVEFSPVPWMMKLNGQTFAQAYDNLFFQLCPSGRVLTCAPGTVTPQPFLEAALGGIHSSYCAGYSSCTAAVVANESSNITGNYVATMWSDLDSSFVFGPSIPRDAGQCGTYCYATTSFGYSNYNALTVSLQKRSTNWTMLANFTYGHALGTIGLNQAYTFDSLNDPWNPGVDYGPQFFDRKFTFNLLGSYQLPFGKGQKFDAGNPVINEIIGGWVISPIFSYGSGLPLDVYTGSGEEWGITGADSNGCSAVPINPNMSYGNAPVFNATITDPTIGANGLPANGGSGVFLFNNPAAVFNNFRPNLVAYDGRCGGGGTLRGQQRWNLDLGLTKDVRITERVGIQLYGQAFNVLNHMEWGDPSLSLQDPADFGALEGQYNALSLGNAPGAAANYTRIIQLGVRIHF